MEITFEQYEDEDAHVYVHPPVEMTAEEVDRLKALLGSIVMRDCLTPAFLSSAPCAIDDAEARDVSS